MAHRRIGPPAEPQERTRRRKGTLARGRGPTELNPNLNADARVGATQRPVSGIADEFIRGIGEAGTGATRRTPIILGTGATDKSAIRTSFIPQENLNPGLNPNAVLGGTQGGVSTIDLSGDVPSTKPGTPTGIPGDGTPDFSPEINNPDQQRIATIISNGLQAQRNIEGGSSDPADALAAENYRVYLENQGKQEAVDSGLGRLDALDIQGTDIFGNAMLDPKSFDPLQLALTGVADDLGQNRFSDEELRLRQKRSTNLLAAQRDEDLDRAVTVAAGRGSGGSTLADAEAQIRSGFRSTSSEADIALAEEQREFNQGIDEFIAALRSGDLKAVAALQNQYDLGKGNINAQLATGLANFKAAITSAGINLDFAGVDEIMDYAPNWEFNFSDKQKKEYMDFIQELDDSNRPDALEQFVTFMVGLMSTSTHNRQLRGFFTGLQGVLGQG